jgi:hypothetical protein
MTLAVLYALASFASHGTVGAPPLERANRLDFDAMRKDVLGSHWSRESSQRVDCYDSHDCMIDGLCNWNQASQTCIASKASCLGSFGCLTHGACHFDPAKRACRVESSEDCAATAFCSKSFLGHSGQCAYSTTQSLCIAVFKGPDCRKHKPCFASDPRESRCKLMVGGEECAMWPSRLDAARLLPSRTTLWPGPVE